MEEYRDEIAEDDILNIVVFHPTRRDLMDAFNYINSTVGGFRVFEGRVDLPDIGPVRVAGFSLEEAKNRIQVLYQQEIKNLEVFLTYRERLIRKVELTGLVATWAVPVDGKVRLFEVMARAGVPPNANLFKSYVLREGCPLPVDLYKLIHEGDMCQNIVMRGGDKIFIAPPAEATVMLMGEVRQPQALAIPNGFISLREAIVAAGGIPFSGDKNCIQVIRGSLQDPKIYVLAWEHVIHLPNDSLLLMPGDTVYVSATAIREWNLFIEQLLPSFGGFQTAWSIYDLRN
jgi:polysaccharide export outer membrane protein